MTAKALLYQIWRDTCLLGGLGIDNPVAQAKSKFEDSLALTESLREIIATSGVEIDLTQKGSR